MTYVLRLSFCTLAMAIAFMAFAAEDAAKKDESAPKASPEPAKPANDEAASDPAADSGQWNFILANYLWATSVKTTVETDDMESTTDVPFSDLLDILKFAGQARVEAWKGPIGLFGDVTYIKLGEATEKRIGEDLKKINIDVKMDLEQVLAEAGGFYRFEKERHSFDVLAGVRYFYLNTDVEVGPFGTSKSTDLFDPFVGGRFQTRLSDRWSFLLRGDVGGFGIGSDFSWSATAAFGYRIRKNIDLGFGYRHLYLEKDSDGAGMETEMSGPLLGVVVHF